MTQAYRSLNIYEYISNYLHKAHSSKYLNRYATQNHPNERYHTLITTRIKRPREKNTHAFTPASPAQEPLSTNKYPPPLCGCTSFCSLSLAPSPAARQKDSARPGFVKNANKFHYEDPAQQQQPAEVEEITKPAWIDSPNNLLLHAFSRRNNRGYIGRERLAR